MLSLTLGCRGERARERERACRRERERKSLKDRERESLKERERERLKAAARWCGHDGLQGRTRSINMRDRSRRA